MAFFSWIRTLVTGHQTIENIPFERWNEEWTEPLRNLIQSNLSILETASDITKIYPTFHSLSTDNKVTVLTQFIKGICWFESAFNPKISCVDVGNGNDKDTWSVGLMQMSVVDQINYNFKLGYTYEDLKDPIKNLILAIGVLVNQVRNKGKILIPLGEKGTYWATIHPKGMYDKSASILNVVHQLKFDHTMDTPKDKPTPVEEKKNETPWMDIALKEVGVSETSNPKRVIEYHQATSLKAKDVKTPWCAAFANWVLMQAGYKRTNSPWARDFLGYGKALVNPQKGCIMVFERNAPGGDSHVTFWTGEETATEFLCCGGNQRTDRVSIQAYPKKDLLGARWPVK